MLNLARLSNDDESNQGNLHHITQLSTYRKLLAKRSDYFVAAILTSMIMSGAALSINHNNRKIHQRSTHIVSKSPVKDNLYFPPSESFKLLKMPSSELEEASKSVLSSRNPFLGIYSTQTSILRELPKGLRLTGIAKVGSSIVAMIDSYTGEKVYKIGSMIGSQFKITKISPNTESVEISNGTNKYRLMINQ